MDWKSVEEQWQQYANNAQEHWSKASIEEITATKGQPERLIRLLGRRYGWNKIKAWEQIDGWKKGLFQ